ncbi:cysteine desulfurase family protein [Solibaculum mannosilyticum]|uniref:cysteine desulfurase n=1 Tax=Solibaculum mannosilyticum TaxID=2780922 RepID=A0A7I8D607_9FIRM|nr:cysteine desulfurase family protein [Solibaculum mannosilyticum]MCO7135957.1 cysteine desulfurase [[Clostridium] leptum]BCI61465.1 cysteine desulfurase [Solibaculum mannosilyticum]
MQDIYLDNSATTAVCKEAVERMVQVMTVSYGNPSSLHQKGIEAEDEMDRARRAVAARLNCTEREIVFTSGGTEANNLALFGGTAAKKRAGKRIVVTQLEHSSVYETADALEQQGFEVIRLAPGPDGKIPVQSIYEAVNEDTILVSMMLVNNETGAIQPVEHIKKAVKKAGAPALIHCDAVQAFGKMSCRPAALGVDLMTVSSHKIHGPKGAGALYIRKGTRILPRQFGGSQEQAIRPGTEGVPSIAGFGAAVEALGDTVQHAAEASKLWNALWEAAEKLPGVRINSPKDALPYVFNLSVEGIRSETMLHFLAGKGIYVSSGSACSKGALSRPLAAMGLDRKTVDSALRISFSRFNRMEHVEALVAGIEEGIARLRK